MPRDLRDDRRYLDEMRRLRERRIAATATAQRLGPEGAYRISRLAGTYPWMRPGQSFALGAGGVEPESELAQYTAEMAYRVDSATGLGGYAAGETVNAADLAGPPRKTVGGGATKEATTQPGTAEAFVAGVYDGAFAGATPGGEEFSWNPLTVGSRVYEQGLKPAVRVTAAAANAGYELLQGSFRQMQQNPAEGALNAIPFYGPYRGATSGDFGRNVEQTTVGQSGVSLGRGDAPELGTGLFADPRGAVEVRRREAMLRYGNVDGHVITPGRFYAARVFEPGSRPFTILSGAVDATVAVAGDPTSIALDAASASRGAANMFSRAGGVRGARRDVDPALVSQWLNGPEGSGFVEFAGRTDDTYEIWTRSGRQMPVDVAHRLATETADGAEARAVLGEEMGITVRERLRVQRPAHRSRWAYDMPSGYVHLDDLDEAAGEVERFLRNVKASDEEVAETISDLAAATGRNGRFTVVRDTMARTEARLWNEYGVSGPQARLMTGMWDDERRMASRFAVDSRGEGAFNDTVLVGGDAVDLSAGSGPQLLDEMVGPVVPLPDARTLRRATSRARIPIGDRQVNFARLLLEQGGLSNQGLAGSRTAAEIAASGGRVLGTDPRQYRLPLALTMFAVENMWKPLVLLRGAWPIRVIGEEQMRMGAAGLDSAFTHPLSFVSWRVGRRSGSKTPIGRGIGRAARATLGETGSTGMLGGAFDEMDEFGRAMSSARGGWIDEPGRTRLDHWDVFDRDHPEFVTAWADELATLHSDVVGRNVARAPDLDAADTWFQQGRFVDDDAGVAMLERGDQARLDLAEAGGEWGRLADDPAAGRRYLESVSERIADKTGGDPTLLEAIRTGNLDGVPMLDRAQGTITPDFRRALEAHLDSAPDAVRGRISVSTGGLGSVGERANRVVEILFSTLMSNRTNNLSRSPAFRQFYARRAQEMMPFMSREAQEHALDWAVRNNLGADTQMGMRQAMGRGAGDLGLDEADVLARGHALDETRNLLYDLSRKGQAFDAMRLVFPFGEAWKEVITRWAGLVAERPTVARRAQQGIQAARGSGFFHQNQNGEEVFSYPLTGALTEFVTGLGGGPGTPMPITGRAQGLSLATELIPGFGPAVQMPAAWLIPNTPRWNEVSGIVMPYGRPTDVRTNVPPWLRRAVEGVYRMDPSTSEAPGGEGQPSQWWSRAVGMVRDLLVDSETQRSYGVAVGNVASYLASTGEYERTPAGNDRLWRDSAAQAGQLFLMRGLASFVAPSAPLPEWQALDENGDTLTAAVVLEDFREESLRDYEGAIGVMLDRYGPDIGMLLNGNTVGLSVGAPVTEEGLTWTTDNPEVRDTAPAVYGLFAPQTGEFDFDAYDAQYFQNERVVPTPEQRIALGRNLVGGWLYRRAQSAAYEARAAQGFSSLTDEQRAALREYQDQLMEDHPGYRPEGVAGIPERYSNEEQIEQLYRAVEIDAVADTPAGEALAEYLTLRDRVAAQAESITGDEGAFRSRAAFAPSREWLRSWAMDLTYRHPEFSPMWERVLSRELDDDLEVAEQGVGG